MHLEDIPIGTEIQIKSTGQDRKTSLTFTAIVKEIIDNKTILVDGLKNEEGRYYRFDNYKNELIVKPQENCLIEKPTQFILSEIKLVAHHRELLSQITTPLASTDFNLRGVFRVNTPGEVQIQLEPNKPTYNGVIKNLSYTGIGFRANLGVGRVPLTMEKLHIGQTIGLSVMLPNKPACHVYANIKRMDIADDKSSVFIGCAFLYENAYINKQIQQIQAAKARPRFDNTPRHRTSK